MREIILLLRGNIRKSKSSYLGIAIMMFIVSLSLTAVLSILINTDKRDLELIKSSGLGNVIAAMEWKSGNESYEEYKTKCEELAEKIENCKDVEKVEQIPAMYLDIIDINGSAGDAYCFIFDMEYSGLNYNIYNENGELLEDFTLNSGEIVVPISLQSLYDAKIGDKIVLGNSIGGQEIESEKSYTITAYMEDPYMGSSLMGIKTMLISSEDSKQYEENKDLSRGIVLSIFKDSNSAMTDTEFDTMLNRETAYASQTWIALTHSQVNNYMTMFTNIFSAILIVFVFMIVIATLVVLNHNISSSIEQDFVNLGILKAVGVSNGKIKISILVGYLLAGLLGAVLGTPMSVMLIGTINDMITPAVGLYGDNTPCFKISILMQIGIFAVFVLFIWIKLLRLKRVTPIKAINSGREDVHFSSLLKLPISKKILRTSLAYRQFSSAKKQYSAAIVVTSILVLFMVMVTDMCFWFGNGGENLNKSFNTVDYDMSTMSTNLKIEEELEDLISKHDSKAERFLLGNKYLMFENSQVTCVICDEPERFDIYEGRSSLYENEVVITEFIVENYGVDIGDTVTINIDGNEAEFLVTGYINCANDAGKCIGMSYEAYSKWAKNETADEENVISTYCYKLSNPELVDNIIADIEKTFKEEEATGSKNEIFSGMDTIVAGVYGITFIIYMISGMFVAVTVVMMCIKIYAKEKQDYGVYKAMGFTAKSLRNMFSIRFSMVAFIGSVVGILLTLLLSDAVIGMVFRSFGMYHFEKNTEIISLVMPIVFTVVVYYVFAYFISRKVNKLTPRVLISE